MSKVVIFDFDGTIADSFGLFVTTLHKMLAKPEPLSEDAINQLRGKQIKEITAELGIKAWQLPAFVIDGRREIANNYSDVTIFKDIPRLIKKLSSTGHDLFILSTNDETAIRMFLERNDLYDHFKQIYADIGLTGKAKSLKKLLKQHGYSAEGAIYIGDEIRDIEASHDANLRCISVDWGYSTANSLKAHHPDFLVTNCSEILEIVEGTNSKFVD